MPRQEPCLHSLSANKSLAFDILLIWIRIFCKWRFLYKSFVIFIYNVELIRKSVCPRRRIISLSEFFSKGRLLKTIKIIQTDLKKKRYIHFIQTFWIIRSCTLLFTFESVKLIFAFMDSVILFSGKHEFRKCIKR